MPSFPRSARRRLSLLDATFLRIETRETPMHVAALLVFDAPDSKGERYVHDVVAELRRPGPLVEPFNLELVGGLGSAVSPQVAPARTVDLEYHVRHTVLPAPGGERELGELVSHLHSVLLDRARPLWTCHVIEGLEGDRFAIYLKVHHALTDGVNGMSLLTRTLARTPEGEWAAPWQATTLTERNPAPARAAGPSTVRNLASLTRGVVGLRARREGDRKVLLPFEAPPSTLNGAVTGARRVATQQLELARVTEVARRSGTSVNDVFLAICSSALRRHLLEQRSLPDSSLVAGVPVSLRQKGEVGGNQVGFVWAELGTDQPDVKARLDAVSTSMRASKDYLAAMTPSARKVATMLTMAPCIGVLLSGLGARLRPPMNVTISNVPGPQEARYLAGSRLRALYPVSIPFQGQGLNISCLTFDGQFNLGFTGCRDSVPHLQHLAVYAGEALDELEHAFA